MNEQQSEPGGPTPAGTREISVFVLAGAQTPHEADRGRQAIAASVPPPVAVAQVDPMELSEVLVRSAIAAADIVLIDARCRPEAGWLEQMRAAIDDDALAGAAAALGPELLGGQVSLRPADVKTASEAARPRLPSVRSGELHCLYVRHEALALIEPQALGSRPDGPTSAIGRIADAVIAAGMIGMLVDDLFVPVEGDGSPGDGSPGDESRPAESGPLARALVIASAAGRPLKVTIDGRALNREGGGTQRYALELALALDRAGDGAISLRVLLPPDPPPVVRSELAERPGIDTVTYDEVLAGAPRADVVHRPQQVFSIDDLRLVRLLGDRFVITHQDLIGYHNPTYHDRSEHWHRFRQATRLALATADRTIFFSKAALADALREELVVPDRAEVIGIAIADPFPEPPRPPDALNPDQAFIVCLGADYRHKNRPFAIRLLSALRDRHGFTGRLVLAGAHVEHGSSAARERELLDADPALAAAVADLGSVSEAERTWLLHHARAVIVPSVVEGFGLMPLEAAAAGTPCAFASVSSLREVVSEELATLVPWDPEASAARVCALLDDGASRKSHVRRLCEDAARWSWADLAPRMIRAYEAAARSAMRPATGLVWENLDLERTLAEYFDLLNHLRGREQLARDDGFFTEAELRGLYRTGSRPALKRALLAPVRLLGRPEGSAGR